MIKNPKILLDTNILVYASYIDSVFHQQSIELLKQNYNFYIADRSLLEFYRVFTGQLKQSVDATLEIVEFYQNNLNFTILNATNFTNQLSFNLARKYNAVSGKIFDLNILAIAIENEIDYIKTQNTKDFPTNTVIKIANLEEIINGK